MNSIDRPTTILVADIGGTNVKFGVTINRVPQPYSRSFASEALRANDPVATLVDMVGEVRTDWGIDPDILVSTVPGFVDRDEDTILHAGNLLRLNGRKLATELNKALGLPVFLERDSVLALMGESAAGAGQGGKAILGIYFGTGVGAAFIHDGGPFRGAGWALEIGHMPFGREGRILEGLKKDCLETYVSGRALRILADKFGVPIGEIFRHEQMERHPALQAAIEDFIRDQAMAIAMACAHFSPEILILGGGVCKMEGFPRDQLERLVEQCAPFTETGRRMDLRWARLGWKGVLYGAPQAVDEHLARLANPTLKGAT